MVPASDSRFHQFPLLWLLLIGAVSLGCFIAFDKHYIAAVIAADRSYLCILISVVFFAASLHAGIHILNAARELARADNYLNHRDGPATSSPARHSGKTTLGLMPTALFDEFIDEFDRLDGDYRQAARIREQMLDILADKLRAPAELGWHLVDILIKLGLMGTIIGFILIFVSLAGGEKPSTENIQALLLTMSSGMGTALYTTLFGLISASLLSLQYVILGRSIEQLIASYIRIGHRRQLKDQG